MASGQETPGVMGKTGVSKREPKTHVAGMQRKRDGKGVHARTHSPYIFCGHLGLIKGKWRAPCSSFKDKTKCCDVIPHQPPPRRREAL